MNPNRSKSLIRILIYFFPAVMDLIMAQFLFVNAVRLAKMGASASVVAGVATVWSLLYMIACPLVGRFVTPSNAARMMMGSAVSLIVFSALFLVVPGMTGIYILCGGVGAASALFFPPFQVFMKAVDTAGEKPITYSTGLYTFSWSMGFALGPFVAGFLMEAGTAVLPGQETNGWRYAYAFTGCAALITLVGIWLLKHLAQPDDSNASSGTTATPAAIPSHFDYSRMPDLAWLGWIGAGVGVIVLSIIRAVFPSRAVSGLHMADSTQGVIFFLLSLTQALTGLALGLSRLWMYRALPIALFGLVGIVGLLGFGFGATKPVLYSAAILFGVYSGAFFFYLVFHALAHPVKSARYVAINESVVGVGGIIGPMVGGLLADRSGFNVSCLAGAALLLVVTLYQIVVHQRNPPVSSPSATPSPVS